MVNKCWLSPQTIAWLFLTLIYGCFHEIKDDWSTWQLGGCKLEAMSSWLRAMALLWPLGSISSGHFYILAGCRLVPSGRALYAVQRRLHPQGRGLHVAGGRFCAL